MYVPQHHETNLECEPIVHSKMDEQFFINNVDHRESCLLLKLVRFSELTGVQINTWPSQLRTHFVFPFFVLFFWSQ